MSKFRVTFDIDLGKICAQVKSLEPDEALKVAEALLVRMLFGSNRKASLREMQRARVSENLTEAERNALMAECLRRVQVSLQGEANLSVEALPADAVIREDTPEREALAA